jgi:hypothetical protein
MSESLTNLINRVQVQLLDDGTRFSSDTVTAAIRSALAKVNLKIPIYKRVEIPSVSEQLTYSLTSAATSAVYCLDILQKDSAGEIHLPLDFSAYNEDNALYFRLNSPIGQGETLIVLYSTLHTVSGLDSETTSTLPNNLDQTLIDGACYEVLAIRAAGITENNLLDRNAPGNYRDAMRSFLATFQLGLAAAQTTHAALYLPRINAWNDKWHEW